LDFDDLAVFDRAGVVSHRFWAALPHWDRKTGFLRLRPLWATLPS
jgi:hypothetical protein